MRKIWVGVILLVLMACGAPNATPTSVPETAVAVVNTPTEEVIILGGPILTPTSGQKTAAAVANAGVPTETPEVKRTLLPTRTPYPTSTKPPIDTPEWFNDVTLYEIFPRSFYDASGDGVGDLDGIAAKLDYLDELGVGALWLTPVFASPSYHGYDTTDYYAVNPEFGTEEDLVELVKEAHARGIKVILDFVAGHTSDEHPFFRDAYGNPDSEYADWYRWLNDEHTAYEHFASATDLPQLNQDNPATRDSLIEVARHWMKTANVDGYRLDYAKNVSHEFWQEFREELKAENPDVLLLGEVWDSGLKIAPYYGELDATFDFPVYFDWMGVHDRVGRSPLLGTGEADTYFSTMQALSRLYPPGAQSVRFLNNHDTVRAASQLEEDPARQKLAATLLMTSPGTPMLYYGQEIGQLGDKRDGDRSVREPMDWYTVEAGEGMTTWNRPATRYNAPDDGISVEEQVGTADTLMEHYRGLMQIRAASPNLRAGEFIPLDVPGQPHVVAYLRKVQYQAPTLILLNFDNEPVSFTLDFSPIFAAAEGFALQPVLPSGDYITVMNNTHTFSLAPLSGAVFDFD